MPNDMQLCGSLSSLIDITDADDPRIAAFKNIRERDLTGRQGHFIVEGTVVLRMLASAHKNDSPFVAECIFVLNSRINGILDILAEFPPDVPVYVADAAIMDTIVGFNLHRGILALGTKINSPTQSTLIEQLPENSLVLAGCGISNHDNLGSMFRNAAAFYADGVFLDETCCDPLYRKSLRVSVGSVLSVPYQKHGTALSMLENLADAGFNIWSLSPSGTHEIRQIPTAKRLALVIGTEGDGLPEAVMQRFHTVKIAQSPQLDSINAGTASGLALYQMAARMGRI